MATINNIFLTKQKSQFVYECINVNVNTNNLTLIDTINTQVYTYKNIELHIGKDNQYVMVANGPHCPYNNFMIQKLVLTQSDPSTFPLLNKYDNIVNRQTKVYLDNGTKTNINLVCDTFNTKESLCYIQINGEIGFDKIKVLLKTIFN